MNINTMIRIPEQRSDRRKVNRLTGYGYLPIFLFLVWLTSCASAPETSDVPSVTDVLSRAVSAHGMDGLDSSRMAFTFRDRDYTIKMDGGSFVYTRSFTDSLGRAVRDELTNDGLIRYRHDTLQSLTPKDSAAYASSVNSVRYFFLLPYGLSDPAVNAELLDTVDIRGQAYNQVRISFEEDGGGEDFDDVYRYFFSVENGELDFLAYTFEAEEGGIRFREAINKRRVNGVLIQDYINYGLDGDDREINNIAERYQEGELPELSRIENTSVRIE